MMSAKVLSEPIRLRSGQALRAEGYLRRAAVGGGDSWFGRSSDQPVDEPWGAVWPARDRLLYLAAHQQQLKLWQRHVLKLLGARVVDRPEGCFVRGRTILAHVDRQPPKP